MSNFVDDDTDLPYPKETLRSAPSGSSAAKYLRASDWNLLCQAAVDLRTAVLATQSRVTTLESAGSSGGGLHGAIMSAVPTRASTGFDWVYQHTASVYDSESGIVIRGPSTLGVNHWECLGRAVPAAPYSIRMLLGVSASPYQTTDGAAFIGWANGLTSAAKQHGWAWKPNYYSGAGSSGTYTLNSATSVNTWTSASYAYLANLPLLWVRLTDDGTNCGVSISTTGDTNQFETAVSINKATGFLGSSGYSNIVFGLDPIAGPMSINLMSWEIE